MKTLACTVLLALCAMTAFAADVTGKWSGTFTPEGGNQSPALVILKQTGDTITGSAGPDDSQQWPMSNGKIDGTKITCDVTSPDGIVLKIALTLDGDKMKGDAAMTREGQSMKAVLELTRAKA